MYNDFLYYNSCFDEYRNMKDKRFWNKMRNDMSQPDKYKWNESIFIEQLILCWRNMNSNYVFS